MLRHFLNSIFLIVSPFIISLNGQNLLSNSSFETYSACPFYVSQLSFANGWYSPTDGTPDYFNSCADPVTFMNVPDNQFGNQSAFEGNAYAGFYAAYNATISVPPMDD